jgi:NTP pyrophosphatase (non-canonical NTP hydrolase)
MLIEDIKKFIAWEISRLDKAHSGSEKEKIFWALSKITEENGELAEQVLTLLGFQRQVKIDKFDIHELKMELADVILVTIILSQRLNIDIEECLKDKIDIVTKRIYKEMESD